MPQAAVTAMALSVHPRIHPSSNQDIRNIINIKLLKEVRFIFRLQPRLPFLITILPLHRVLNYLLKDTLLQTIKKIVEYRQHRLVFQLGNN